MSAPTPRETTGCEQAIAQVLAENLACHPALMQWLTRRTLPDLSVELAPDSASVDIARATHDGDVGWDVRVIGDFGPIGIAILIAIRFAYRVGSARKAKEAARALAESGEVAVATAVWLTADAIVKSMGDEPMHYDKAVTIEALLAMLRGEARCAAYELQRRREFQIGLIESALDKAMATAVAPADPRETFRKDYLDLIADEAPLLLTEEARNASTSDFGMLIFDSGSLPHWPFLPAVRLAQHLREGAASILIHDWGEDIDALAGVMEPALDKTPYSLARAPSRPPGGKPGVLLLVDIPSLDPERPFAAQRRQAREAVRAVDALRAWFAGRKAVVGYWADFVGGQTDTREAGHRRVRKDVDFG